MSGDAEDAMSGPQNKHIRVENKNFYFDIKRNQQGRYMSISEVKGNYRNSILVPESGWESFRDVLDEYVKQVQEEEILKKILTRLESTGTSPGIWTLDFDLCCPPVFLCLAGRGGHTLWVLLLEASFMLKSCNPLNLLQ